MGVEKAFEQLKLSALEVKAILIEMDENIQPSVDSIDNLNKKIADLSEHLAVYKYLKSQKELSPHFNLHVKVMEQTEAREEVKTGEEMPSVEKGDDKTEVKDEPIPSKHVKKMELGLNDKFRMINELFNKSSTEFNLAIDQLNTFDDYEKSVVYLKELQGLYSWKDEHELTVRIFQINKKRFD